MSQYKSFILVWFPNNRNARNKKTIVPNNMGLIAKNAVLKWTQHFLIVIVGTYP